MQGVHGKSLGHKGKRERVGQLQMGEIQGKQRTQFAYKAEETGRPYSGRFLVHMQVFFCVSFKQAMRSERER